jgi:P27 family predicted phage terminase small subunit
LGKPTGPPPKLAEQRVLEGHEGHVSAVSHRHVPAVISLAPKIEKNRAPKPPPDLPKEGKELWDEVIPWLTEVNAVQLIDLPAVKAMCVAWAQAERLRKVLDEQGYFTLGSMGQQIVHPAFGAYQNASRLFLSHAQEFGMTTVARTRLGLMDVQRKSIAQEMDWTLGPSTRNTVGE